MKSTITFFPVDNGDMTLIKLSDKTTILIDINLRESAEDDEDPSFDAAKGLRERLKKDDDGRPFVDVFLLTHPDQDHCRGLRKHFHLGSLNDYDHDPPEGEELKIVIREIWSSPMVFRRTSKNNPLCEDARGFNTEARRRVKLFRDNGFNMEGDRILIIGEDEEGKTEGLEPILVKLDEIFSTINGKRNDHISMRVLGPFSIQEDSEEEERLRKNRSSVILQYSFVANGQDDACLFLTGGDAEVYIWEKLWGRKKSITSHIQYDLLLTPHHCSWHSLSYDSWSEDENPQVSQDAKLALSQARDGAFIVSSSKPIKDDKNDPPCWGAKMEYISILESGSGKFYCTGEHPNEEAPEPLIFKISKEGPQPPSKKSESITGAAVAAGSTKEPSYHG
ncbi:MAG: metallohydrolase [Deltaproteobacteria bacterium]|nr:metallohydrolase [Deltaproteobacteria bacterium]